MRPDALGLREGPLLALGIGHAAIPRFGKRCKETQRPERQYGTRRENMREQERDSHENGVEQCQHGTDRSIEYLDDLRQHM